MLTDASVTPTLRAQRPEAEALAGLIAAAHLSGLSPDWHALVREVGLVELPTYAFQRERYWLSPRVVGSERGIGHPLLTTAVPVAGTEQWLFSGRLSLSTHPWVADHVLLDTVVVPGTTFLEMSLEAGSRLGAEPSWTSSRTSTRWCSTRRTSCGSSSSSTRPTTAAAAR